MTLFLSLFYSLICIGYVVGFLSDNDDISKAGKVLMAIFSPILAPLFLGIGLGMIIDRQLNKEKGE